MNMEELLSHTDFESRGDSFRHVSINEMKQLVVDYYFKETTFAEMISKYKLKENKNKVRRDFPKLLCDEKCKYDDSNMYKDLPSKEYIHKFALKSEIFKCTECGHTNEAFCRCCNCLSNYEEEINNNYISDNLVDISNCSLTDRIYLGALLQGLHASDNYKDFGPYEMLNTTENPIFINGFGCLKQLANKKVITVSSSSELEGFALNDNFPNEYYPTKVKWHLNVTSSQISDVGSLYEYLKYPNASIVKSKTEVDSFWREAVIYELMRLLDYQMEEFSFFSKHDTDRDKVKDLFMRLLETLTPSQIYSLIWMSVRKADNSRTRNTWGNFRYNHVDFLIKNIEDIRVTKLNNNQEIDSYNYPNRISLVLSTKIFFEQVALFPHWFVLKVPSNIIESDVEHKVIDFYENLYSDENQFFDEKEFNFDSYYLTNFGVVAFDGIVKWLFTDEKTLYQIGKFIEKKNRHIDEERFYDDFKIPYYIEETYSTIYILSLINFLLQSDFKYYYPEEDRDFVNSIESKLNR